MSDFTLISWAAAALVVVCAALFRSRAYALARGITLTLHTLIASALAPHAGPLEPVFLVLHTAVYLQSLSLVWARLRPLWVVATISVPGLFFAAGTLLAFPWAIAAAFGLTPHGFWLPYLVSAVGVWQSLSTRTEENHVVLGDGAEPLGIVRHPTPSGPRAMNGRPLRIVQLTDPHLGPFMSVARLRRICERAVARDPDLILLTGDFLTMESQGDAKWLASALEPLRRAPGKVFACLGNHDHEALGVVRQALSSAGVHLLVDDSTLVQTDAGPVQIIGFDFAWRERAQHLQRVCAAHPRQPGALRLALLHDPGAFKHLPAGEADLVLSGHTHGGQLGLVSLRLSFTIAHAFSGIPDHGLWARGNDRLYVHRGTGHYGFPLRLGVPAEESLLLVHAT